MKFDATILTYHTIANMDAILPGAATRTIRDRSGRLPLLLDHASSNPIGFMDIRETSNGVAGTATILPTTTGMDTWEFVKAGVRSEISIGFAVTRYRMRPEDGIREISELDLYEASLLVQNFAADANCVISKIYPETVHQKPEQLVAPIIPAPDPHAIQRVKEAIYMHDEMARLWRRR